MIAPYPSSRNFVKNCVFMNLHCSPESHACVRLFKRLRYSSITSSLSQHPGNKVRIFWNESELSPRLSWDSTGENPWATSQRICRFRSVSSIPISPSASRASRVLVRMDPPAGGQTDHSRCVLPLPLGTPSNVLSVAVDGKPFMPVVVPSPASRIHRTDCGS